MASNLRLEWHRVNMARGDPYRVLGIDRAASADEVEAAYKTLVRARHSVSHV